MKLVEDNMDFKKVDFFQPAIIVVAILVFLLIRYIGSFNYRFEDPLKLELILTIFFAIKILSQKTSEDTECRSELDRRKTVMVKIDLCRTT